MALFYEGDDRWKFRFGFLLTLSVTIASMGLLANSAAIVIGAMLIAPLMIPVMGLAYGIVFGLVRRIARSAATIAVGSVWAIVLAWLLPKLIVTDTYQTTEILARTSPDIKDLVVALAAGGAGAYATLRDDGSAALPGVAVAVALVPPLAAVGLALNQGRTDLAGGALLLYVTNLAAIIFAGVVVMLVSGFVPRRRLDEARHHVFTGTTIAIVVVLILAVPLTAASYQAAQSAQDLQSVEKTVQAWLTGNAADDLEVAAVDISTERVTIDLVGPVAPPDRDPLLEAIGARFGSDVEVEVRWSQRTSPADLDQETADLDELTAEIGDIADAWLAAGGGTGLEITGVTIEGATVTVTVAGAEAPPTADALQTFLDDQLETSPEVRVDWTVRQVAGADAADTTLDAATAVAGAWAGDIGLDLFDVALIDGTILIDVIGPTPPTRVEELQNQIRAELGDNAEIKVRYIPRVAVTSG